MAKRCFSCSHKFKSGKNHPLYGNKWSEEAIKNMLETRKRNYKPENHSTWKGGISKQKGYHNFYNRQYLYRKKGAVGSHTKEEWNALKRMYGYMCLCCKMCEPDIELTADHIIPLSKGGDNYIENIQPLCRSCNGRKKDKHISYIDNISRTFNQNG